MEEDTAPFGQREGHGADSAADGLDAWSAHCSATVDADVGRVSSNGGGDCLAEVGHSGCVENGAISGGAGGSRWDVIGSNGVA